MCLEGAVRKWIFPEWSMEIYLVKDFIVAIMLIASFSASRFVSSNDLFWGWRKSWISFVLPLYGGIVFIDAFNPNLPNLALGLWGLKVHLLYISLLFIIPIIYQRWPGLLWRDVRIILFLGIGIAVLGLIQFSLPPGHFLNRYVVEGSSISTFGITNAVRVTGTFPYITGMTVFMLFTTALSLTILLSGPKNTFWLITLTASVALMGAAMVMTGSRWGAYMLILFVLFISYQIGVRLLSRPAVIGLVFFAIALFVAATFWDNALQALILRAQSASDKDTRVATMLFGFWRFITEVGALGYGSGSTHQAAPALVPGGFYEWLSPIDIRTFEDEPSRVLVELGLIGFVVILSLRLFLISYGLWVIRVARGTAAFPLAVFYTFSLIALGTGSSSVIFNPTANLLFWYSASVLVYLHHEVREVRAREVAHCCVSPMVGNLRPVPNRSPA